MDEDARADKKPTKPEESELLPVWWGCVVVPCLVLVALVMVVGAILQILATANAKLVHTGGPAPETEFSFRHVGAGLTDNKRYTFSWRVRDSLESTLSVRGTVSVPHLRRVDDVSGALTAYVPAGCSDRAIRWQITVNGREADAGTFQGQRAYVIPTDYSSDGDLDTVVIAADWDGGTEACPRFRLVWDTKALEP
ncbi:hypothetical protein ACQEVY_30975 [Streptomyces sp. CA-288835]|uniref:hypothetical protein n=1 Tax=Streptomyces sp. CA-288835 TaxID=3240069 RepID=UPI003D8A7DBE